MCEVHSVSPGETGSRSEWVCLQNEGESEVQKTRKKKLKKLGNKRKTILQVDKHRLVKANSKNSPKFES